MTAPPPCLPPRNHAIPGADLDQWYRWGREQGQRNGVPQRELDWFIEAVTDVDRLALRLGTLGDRPAIQSQFDLEALTQCWEQRCRDRTPVQYLAGHTPWRSFTLRVSPAVLIPRPETELLVDLIDQKLREAGHLEPPDRLNPPRAPLTIADLGTGSGAIALGLASLLPPTAQIYGVDCSAEAIAIARHNAQHCLPPSRTIKFLQGSWFEPLAFLQGQLTAMVANPPYIPTATVATLAPEVTHHEPHLALDGGQDGLDDIRHLITQGVSYLCAHGLWAVEHMAGQGDTIAQLLEKNGHYSRIEIHQDLAGRDRFVTAIRRP